MLSLLGGVRLVRTNLLYSDVQPVKVEGMEAASARAETRGTFQETLAQSLFDHIPVGHVPKARLPKVRLFNRMSSRHTNCKGVGSMGIIPTKEQDLEEARCR